MYQPILRSLVPIPVGWHVASTVEDHWGLGMLVILSYFLGCCVAVAGSRVCGHMLLREGRLYPQMPQPRRPGLRLKCVLAMGSALTGAVSGTVFWLLLGSLAVRQAGYFSICMLLAGAAACCLPDVRSRCGYWEVALGFGPFALANVGVVVLIGR